jgi:hypothetical protein
LGSFSKLILNAVVLTTAFFLHANSNCKITYIDGLVETISDKDKGSTVETLDRSSTVQYDDLICTGKGARIELLLSQNILRIGTTSVLSLKKDNEVSIHSGSFLFCSTKHTIIKFSSIGSEVTFSGSGTIILETTQNGGFKFIPLEGRGKLICNKGSELDVLGGRMVLVLDRPTRFGDAYDIDLMLMLKTSNLINAYPDPLASFGRISLAVYSQELRIKGKYNALIGDAPTNDNLQIWAFED